MDFKFDCAWQPEDPDIKVAAHRRTLANLRIAVGEQVLTLNRSPGGWLEEEPAEAICLSMFPMAEFVSANWWALLHEPSEKTGGDAAARYERHWIHRHRNGFAYPRLAFWGAESSIRVVSEAYAYPSANVEFLTSTAKPAERTAWEALSREQVEDALLMFLAETLGRIGEGRDGEPLAEMLAAIERSRADPEERSYCTYAGMLGGNPYEAGDELFTAISDVVETLGEPLAKELFAVSERDQVAARAHRIRTEAASAVKRSKAAAEHAHGLKKDMAGAVAKQGRPWEIGYSAARSLRKLIGIPADAPVGDEHGLVRAFLGEDFDVTPNLGDWDRLGARGLGVDDERGFGLAVAPNPNRNRIPLFRIAKTFGDYLLAPQGDIFIATASPTDRQKANGAFGAEFLMPIEAIRSELGAERPTEENCTTIARQYGVPMTMVQYQIQNQAPDLIEPDYGY